jgi:hypothetical protein
MQGEGKKEDPAVCRAYSRQNAKRSSPPRPPVFLLQISWRFVLNDNLHT